MTGDFPTLEIQQVLFMALVSTMSTLEVLVTTDGEGAEAVAQALYPFAQNEKVFLTQNRQARSVHSNYPRDEITVKVYISSDKNTPSLRNRIEQMLYYLGRLYPMPSPVFTQSEVSDPSAGGTYQTQSLRLGKHWLIQHSSQEPSAHLLSSDITLKLDSGSAFGTGLHPSTHLCMSILEGLVQPGMNVLDVGTGSGILAIAAAKLNAHAYGVDTDTVAVAAARANVQLNNVALQVTIEQGELKNVLQRNWDLVIANITPKVIHHLLHKDSLIDYLSADGRLMLSGINQPQAAMIKSAITSAKGQLIQTVTMGKDWLAFVIAPHAN